MLLSAICTARSSVSTLITSKAVLLSRPVTSQFASYSYYSPSSFQDRSTNKGLFSVQSASLHTNISLNGVGDYDKLIASAASSRGIGRSNKPKHTRKADDDKYLLYNQSGAEFRGFHKPFGDTREVIDQSLNSKYDESTLRKLGLYKPPLGKRKKFDVRFRGYTGRSWPGRFVGVPHTPAGDAIEGLESVVMSISARRRKNKASMKRAMVAVGNKKGMIGFGTASATVPVEAIKKARNQAAQQLVQVPLCEDINGSKTIVHNMSIKLDKNRMNFQRKPPGYGIHAQRMTKSIVELAGITDLRVKKIGRLQSKRNHVTTVLHALQAQETHQELAQRTGKYVVEYRSNQEGLPVVVASPSLQAVQARMLRKETESDINIADYLDGSKGAHRTKSNGHVKKNSSFY